LGVRDWINKNPAVVSIAAGAGILSIVVYAVWSFRSGAGGPPLPQFPDKAFFSADDGATYFTDRDVNVPPFDYKSKQAVRAYVYTCDGGHKWVRYLEKYTPAAREAQLTVQSGKSLPPNAPGPMSGVLVKKPGAGDWVPNSSPDAQAIIDAKCPTHPNAALEPVMP
jgi:hypothetical protein